VTYSVSGAIENSAQVVKQKLFDLASDHFEVSPDDLEIQEGIVQVKGSPDHAISIGDLAGMAESRLGGPGPIMGEGQSAMDVNAPGFVVHLAKVAIDPDTGQVDLKQYVAIQDVGFALNPMMVEGQIHGGAVQGIGMGLHEALIYDETGQLLTGSFMDYDLPKINTVPNIETIMIQNPSAKGPFGARGVGEPPIIPGTAAIANAIKDAIGVRISQVPILTEMVWEALQEKQ
ncbi:MAG: molybdopterin cofactor-binding domain-containing protein, partial [Chloroflexota bacterium]